MEVILGAIISAIAAVIVAVIGYMGLVKKDYYDLKTTLNDNFQKVNNENGNLSAEHKQISEKQTYIADNVYALLSKANAEEYKNKMLSKDIKKVKNSVKEINAILEDYDALQERYQLILKENQNLKQQLRQYELQFNQEDELEP